MRRNHFMLALVPVVLTGLLLGCNRQPADPAKPDGKNEQSAAPHNSDIGSPLYEKQPTPVYQTVITRNPPIVIPNALVQFDERQVVSAEVDGTIDVIATLIKEGETVNPDQIVFHPRDVDKKIPLRRLSESDEVIDGQIIAFLDDQQISARRDGASRIKEAAQFAREKAKEGSEAAKERYELIQKVGVGGSKQELLDAFLTYTRFKENEAQAEQAIAKAIQEFDEATVLLGKHRIKSRVNGFIRNISKRPGEYVKAGEKILEIEATDRVRIEGQLDVQYATYLKRGMTVTVEPAVPSAPITSHKGHRQAVTGIAVTSHPDSPLVVSVGADGGALVWDPNLGKQQNRPSVPHNLPHPVGVRSVAATPRAAKNQLVITGADDGKIRIWDVSNTGKLPSTPKTVPEEVHTSAVQAIAISPDGRHFATAAGRDVFIWELASARKLYTLPDLHRDSITSISFTPQNTLVTVSKDSTTKVWNLGTTRAAVERTIDHRAGAVEVLGVSRDGSRLLFDQDKTRIDLIDPANGQTVGQIENVSSAGSFSTLAIFGPDDSAHVKPEGRLPLFSIATAGGDGDLKGTVQYWLAPRTGGRGAEVGRLITPGRAPVTAAVFSPPGEKQFLVVGTAAGGVHLWQPPTEARETNSGRIVNIDATDTRYVTVRVEMNNKTLKLLDRSTATIIIPINQ